MRKTFIIMIAAMLLLGAAGCVNIRVSGTQSSSTPDTEVSSTHSAGISTEQEDRKAIDALNASNIATGINAYNALFPDNVFPDGITLQDAKETLKETGLWPEGLSDEDAEAAWGLIVYKGSAAELTPEAREAGRDQEEPEQTVQGVTGDARDSLNYANASNIATGINAYNALNPNSVLPDDITLEGAKEVLSKEYLWPAKLTDEEAKEAWKLIIYKDGIAGLVPEE